MEKHNCEYCNKEMTRQATSFMKCPDRKCTGSHFGVRKSDMPEARGVDRFLFKKV